MAAKTLVFSIPLTWVIYSDVMKGGIDKELAEKEEQELLEETPPATAPPRDPPDHKLHL